MFSNTKTIPIITFQNFKILIDSGSDINLITEQTVKQYNMKILEEFLEPRQIK